MQIDLNGQDVEYHNVVQGIRGLEVRPGFLTELIIQDIGVQTPRAASGTSTKFLYGFSIDSANSGETYHYLFTADANSNLICSLYDSQMTCRSSFAIGKMTQDAEPFSVAINYNQIVVNSRSMPYPLWGFVGGSLVKANRVESINPDTPALTLFPGRVCGFADRFAWAYANQVIFNDPGTEPRTITAPNAISFGGTVLDLFQSGEGGNLIVVCTDATYSIPPDGLNGFQFQGVIARIPGYQGARSNNAATSRGTTVGLVKDGVINIANFEKRSLSTYRRRRNLSLPVGPFASGDYRVGSIIGADDNFMINIAGKSCMIDLDTGKATWMYPTGWSGSDFEVVGVLKDTDGKNIYLTPTAVVELFGVNDYGETPTVATPEPLSATPSGFICVNIASDPQLSPVVREITTSADRPGQIQYSYVRSSLQQATTPIPQNAVVIGTSLWSATGNILEREYRSRRMQRAVRVDSPDMEVGFTGGGTRIYPVVDMETKGIGKNRPSN